MYRDPYHDRPSSFASDFRRRQDEFDKSFKRTARAAVVLGLAYLIFWATVIIALVLLAWRVWG